MISLRNYFLWKTADKINEHYQVVAPLVVPPLTLGDVKFYHVQLEFKNYLALQDGSKPDFKIY
ncbi:MAG TPA: hypothetical protein VMZ69_06995 [Saprospiraceae bacterium]|nr:hypothetical protein [Saprospiraceae bacterium]